METAHILVSSILLFISRIKVKITQISFAAILAPMND